MRDTIVILGGNVIGYGIVRALKDKDLNIIIAKYNPNDFGQHSKYVSKSYTLPNPNTKAKEYLEELERIGRDNKGALLVPANDDTLLICSKNKRELEKYFKVFCADYELQKIFLEKKYTYKLCEKIGVPIPKTFYPKTLKDFNKFEKDIPYPSIIKPNLSHEFVNEFGVKLFKANNLEELKKGFVKANEKGHEVLVQEYIEDADDNVQDITGYVDKKNKLRGFFLFRKLRLNPPGKGVTRLAITDNGHLKKTLREYTQKIAKESRYYGFMCPNYIYDKKDGKCKLMEVNTRFSRTHYFSTFGGVNIPEIMYDEYFGNSFKKYEQRKGEYYWIDLYADIVNSIFRFNQEKVSFKEYFRPYFNEKVFAVWNSKDLMPFTFMILNLPLKYIRILKNKLD